MAGATKRRLNAEAFGDRPREAALAVGKKGGTGYF